MQVLQLLLEVLLLGVKGRVSSLKLGCVPLTKVVNFATIAVLLLSELIAVPLVEPGMFVSALAKLLISPLLIISELTIPLLLTLVGPVSEVGDLLVFAIDFGVMSLILFTLLLEMGLLGQGCLPLLLLNLGHELLDLGLQTILELLFHLSVFLHLLSSSSESCL